jgi:hypothetical protein
MYRAFILRKYLIYVILTAFNTLVTELRAMLQSSAKRIRKVQISPPRFALKPANGNDLLSGKPNDRRGENGK